jgi:DNA repair exonuclease SbcCD nuclease subunit
MVRQDPTIDHIMFLGDWFEHRTALNISTLNYSYRGAKLLNDLGLPVFFMVGNHDLYYKNSREIHSTVNFNEFANFKVIDEPEVVPNIGNGAVLSPYLFHEEYPSLDKFLNMETWWGHFEFKGFVVTGYSITMQTGPEHTAFKGPKRIFSGHFHKRQISDNVVYIGNTFPTSFADANDDERGMAVYDHETDDITFVRWPDAPSYKKVLLSDLMEDNIILPDNCRVKCDVNVPITYEESSIIKEGFVDAHNLRELILEENTNMNEVLKDTEVNQEVLQGMVSIDDMVMAMLGGIDVDDIDSEVLIKEYQKLTVGSN